MKQRSVLALISLGVLVPSASADAPAQKKTMNVLFLISDDMRVELGSYRGTLAQTPNLDALAKRSVRFERAYCQYPLCCPSRSSMLTGRTPLNTDVYGNREFVGDKHPDWKSIPRYFRDQGFDTLRTGKIFHGGLDDTEAWTQGGEPRRYGKTQAASGFAKPEFVSPEEAEEYIRTMTAADLRQAPGSDRWEAVDEHDLENTRDTAVADQAIRYLQDPKRKNAPFLLACGFSKPHSPLVAPKRFFDLYKVEDIPLPVDFAPRPTVPEGFPAGSIRPNTADLFISRDATPAEAKKMILAYLACVSYVDWNVGRVLEELERQGLSDSTVIVFWSDHGYQLGEKGKWSKAGSLWEQGTRVPFIIYDPRAKGNGRASTRIVQAIDIYPTLAELAGLEIPAGLDGRSLRPLLDDPEREWKHPAFTVWNEHNKGLTGAVVRTERWRYAEFFGRGAGAMLTDPLEDPHELKNLVSEPRYADVVKELSATLHGYIDGHTELDAPEKR